MQIISSGPDSSSKEIRDNYLRLIHMARRNIYIQTPYFIPDDDIPGRPYHRGQIRY